MVSKRAISSMSLGRCSAGHTLDSKLDAAKSYTYEGIEICYEDLIEISRKQHLDLEPATPVRLPDQKAAALTIRSMCGRRGIKIVCLQPFSQYEGLLDRREHDSRFKELLIWIKLARLLGTDMIMIPASSLHKSEVTNNLELIVEDFQRAADAGREESPHIRFAYESRCSATHINRWEYGWTIVERVDRPNFGMCLDTFHIAGRIFADPSSPSGRIPNAERVVEMSMQHFIKRVKDHREKVFLVRVGDARQPDEPIVPGSLDYDTKERPRMSWSRKYRLFYGEEARGAFLPIKEIANAIFNGIGFEGWVSFEIVNSRMDCKEANVPRDLARRGYVSWRKLSDDMGWWPMLPLYPSTGPVC
ncbi:putative dehydroshikimate dehydratase [Annulohypoxylon bovei var. microspora]|nr:putative dehydroshikimate dehydratase [Annulohypoxylon bovei var. microspora]